MLQVYEVGQGVFAKWTDRQFYPGKVEKINDNGRNYNVTETLCQLTRLVRMFINHKCQLRQS